MVMSITITKSSPVLVGPSTAPATPVTDNTINLSSFDKDFAFLPATSFHVFKHGTHKPAAETVRTALSHALTHYFPLAGRFVKDGDDDNGSGDLRIACTGEGVAFVAASANCTLDDVKLFDPPFGEQLLEELSANNLIGVEGFRESDPLLLMQVTEFTCGGFIVEVTWNHGIADGVGSAQFLRAVAELARGLPQPSILPVGGYGCGDDSLPENPALVATVEKTMSTMEHQEFAYLDITIPSSCINRIKVEFAGHDNGDGEPCTAFEAVTAVLWQCRTRVVMSDPKTPTLLMFAVNVRKEVGAKYGYYGNCITSAVAVPASGEVANGDIRDVVKLIKHAKQQILCHFKNAGGVPPLGVSSIEEPQVLGGLSSTEQLEEMFRYSAFVVSSWQNIGVDAVDFGGGSPARVMGHMAMAAPNCVTCLPYKGKDGANVLARCVKEKDVDAFLGEVAKFV
ncbi:unnamed protein product [Urochloa humidicola]